MFFVILGWVLFRADSITAAGQYIGNMFGAGATGFIDATFIDCVKNSAAYKYAKKNNIPYKTVSIKE